VLPFARVEEGVGRLDAVLKRGGWLALANSQYRFEDMAFAGRYERVETIGKGGQPDPLYGSDDRLIEMSSRPSALYRKLRD
jgi:hypothetical protein